MKALFHVSDFSLCVWRLALVVHSDPKYVGLVLLVLIGHAPSGFVVLAPSGLVVIAPSGLEGLAPSGLAVLTPSGLAVLAPSEFLLHQETALEVSFHLVILRQTEK